MTCSIRCSSRRAGAALALAALAAGASGCAGTRGAVWPGHSDAAQPLRVMLLPPENLSATHAPLGDIGLVAERALARAGLEVVSGVAVDEFLARYRIRNTGGLDAEAARHAREELGVSAAVVTSIVLYGESAPPRVGVIMRLVSVAEQPEILWIDGFGRTGNDAPGLLGIGIVHEVGPLREEAFRTLARSLRAFLRDARRNAPSCDTSKEFAPKVAYRSPALARKDALSVAVLPFVNGSGRRDAGEVVALEVTRQLAAVARVRVVEPGRLRQELLRYRVTTEGGATLMTARLLAKVLDVDLVVGGVVRDFADQATPIVTFSVLALDTATEEVVWESMSYNDGDDSMGLFGTGTVSTANVLTCRMARTVVGQMMQRRGRRASESAAARAPVTPPDPRAARVASSPSSER